MEEWNGFQGEKWRKKVDVEDFIINNYKEYKEDESFLQKSSKKTSKVWSRCQKLLEKEFLTKVLDVETMAVSGIDNFDAGYIDKKNEVIFGLQTDEPLKRIMNLDGSVDSVKQALSSYGYQMDHEIEEKFSEYRKNYQDGILGTYTNSILKYRDAKIFGSFPEDFSRGKILGDYRRLALYGADYLILRKKHDLTRLNSNMNFALIRTREEVQEQIKALEDIKEMASRYDIDISRPAGNAKDAFQWLYFAYLATIKQSNGAINSFGRNTAFLDIYIERDLENGTLTEEGAQELVDQLIIKLRLVRHLRRNEYRESFIGDPSWITESIGGMYKDDISFVTKTSYRFLNTLSNLSSSPEPNFVVLWSEKLPDFFKRYVSKLALETHVIQFVNDDVIRSVYGTNYAITGSSSVVKLGSQMIYFGGSCNLPKALLYAINNGKDEVTKEVMVEGLEPLTGTTLDFQKVLKNFVLVVNQFIHNYVEAQNIIHYMQDKYAYESASMAFLDTITERKMSFGFTGLTTVADSFSAIRYGKLKVTRDEDGFVSNFQTDAEFPRFGNSDIKVDKMAYDIIKIIAKEIKKQSLYRNAIGTVSLQTIADHVYYGEATGATPDGRLAFTPFSPGANPVDGKDTKGARASLKSVAKIPYLGVCDDGITNNISISPTSLGETDSDRVDNFVTLIQEYFNDGGEHLNINVMSKNELLNMDKTSEKYIKLIVRYAECGVRLNALTKNQQEEFLSRTFHDEL